MSFHQEIKELADRLFGGGAVNPEDLVLLLQTILDLTVFDAEQQLILTPPADTGVGVIGGLDRFVFLLNDGNFLKFFMEFEQRSPNVLTVTQSCFQYQTDEAKGISKKFVFRYDYNTEPQDRHPPAHLQINGELQEKQVTTKKLEKIWFPVVRPSVESLATLLIDSFGLTPNNKDWREILQYSEGKLFYYRAQQAIASYEAPR